MDTRDYTKASKLALSSVVLGAGCLVMNLLTVTVLLKILEDQSTAIIIAILSLVSAIEFSLAVIALVLSHIVAKQGAKSVGRGTALTAYVGFGLAIIVIIPSCYFLAVSIYGIVSKIADL